MSPRSPRERGISLIEVMVAIAIVGILVVQGLPTLNDYMANAQLRSAGQIVLEQTLFAQNEAIRRNGRVQVVLSGSQVQVVDVSTPATPVQLRNVTLPGGVRYASMGSTTPIVFGSQGRPPTFGDTYRANLSPATTNATCSSSNLLCPAVIVDAGGAVSMCNDRSIC